MSDIYVPELMELDCYWENAIKEAVADTLHGRRRLQYATRNRNEINKKLEGLGFKPIYMEVEKEGKLLRSTCKVTEDDEDEEEEDDDESTASSSAGNMVCEIPVSSTESVESEAGRDDGNDEKTPKAEHEKPGTAKRRYPLRKKKADLTRKVPERVKRSNFDFRNEAMGERDDGSENELQSCGSWDVFEAPFTRNRDKSKIVVTTMPSRFKRRRMQRRKKGNRKGPVRTRLRGQRARGLRQKTLAKNSAIESKDSCEDVGGQRNSKEGENDLQKKEREDQQRGSNSNDKRDARSIADTVAADTYFGMKTSRNIPKGPASKPDSRKEKNMPYICASISGFDLSCQMTSSELFTAD